MQFCEDIEKVIKEYTRPYRDPRSHKNHKRVMAQIKRISKCWRRLLRISRKDDLFITSRLHHLRLYAQNHCFANTHRLPPPFVKTVQHCFLPSL